MKHFTIKELCATSHPTPNNPTQDIIRNLEALSINVLDTKLVRLGSGIYRSIYAVTTVQSRIIARQQDSILMHECKQTMQTRRRADRNPTSVF